MLLGLGVTVLLGHTKVNNVDDILRFRIGSTNEEIVGLDVAVDQVFLVYRLHAGQHLLGDHDNGLDGEAASAVVEEVLERGSEQVNDKNVVEAFLAKVIDIGNTSCMLLLVNVF